MRQTFENAFNLHRNGDLDAARSLYVEIIAADPAHFDAIHLLGLLCHQTGAAVEAEHLFKLALGMKPDFHQLYSNYARVLHDERRFEEALACYEAAIILSPGDHDVYFDCGALLQETKHLDGALRNFDKSITIQADQPMAFNNRGVVLRDQRHIEASLQNYEQAITLDPSYALAYSNKGSALKALHRVHDAIASYDIAISIDPIQADFHYNRGNSLIELNRLDESLRSLSDALALNETLVEAFFCRGNVFQMQSRFHEAIVEYDMASSLRHDHAQVHSSKGEALRSLGQMTEAVSSLNQAIMIEPTLSEAYFNRANTFRNIAQHEQALVDFDRAIAIRGEYAEAFLNKGMLLKHLNRTAEALASYDQALAAKPEYADAFLNRGELLMEWGLFELALESYDFAIAAKPDYAGAHNNRGNANYNLKRFDEALKSYKTATALRPDFPEGFLNIGATLMEISQFREALIFYQHAIVLKPDYPDAYNNLALALKEAKRYDEALANFDKSLVLKPDYAQTHNNRGVVLKELRIFDEALDCFQEALRLAPGYFSTHSNLLFTMNYMDQVPIAERLHEAKLFGANASVGANPKFEKWRNTHAPQKIRLGFVSGDFGNHPVGYFLEGLLSHLDTSKFELVGYTTDPLEDNLTLRLKEKFQLWRSLFGNRDSAAAQMIHEDGVHILIDLSGHTAKNRLPVFAFKPAPVQASWLGYFATTGVREMDYFIGDPYVTPPHEEHHFSERIRRLPETYLCFTPPSTQIEVGALPALVNGYVTFGSFNNFSKINAAVITLWAEVLHVVKDSRLFMKAAQFDDLDVVAEARHLFESHGVAPERLSFGGQTNRTDYFKAYNRVDIALDPFPYPGGTTSVEGLWMGVPVIARKGHRFIAHNGETIAHNAGQAHWIAEDDNDYLRKAVLFSSDLAALARTRAALRGQVIAAPICDAARFAGHFEALMEDMWRDYQRSAEPHSL